MEEKKNRPKRGGKMGNIDKKRRENTQLNNSLLHYSLLLFTSPNRLLRKRSE